jgi:hypothetical protein
MSRCHESVRRCIGRLKLVGQSVGSRPRIAGHSPGSVSSSGSGSRASLMPAPVGRRWEGRDHQAGPGRALLWAEPKPRSVSNQRGHSLPSMAMPALAPKAIFTRATGIGSGGFLPFRFRGVCPGSRTLLAPLLLPDPARSGLRHDAQRLTEPGLLPRQCVRRIRCWLCVA